MTIGNQQDLKRKLRDALASADVWHERHAEAERKRLTAEKLHRDAKRRIEDLERIVVQLNERIVTLNQALADKIASDTG